MNHAQPYDVLIIGGSYAGLSAALALGRSLRRVLIVDGGQPCNRQTPHSHNFITQDGEQPGRIAEKAKAQVLAYETVQFRNGLVTSVRKTASGFEAGTDSGERLLARKLLFATGVADLMPGIKGFAECWGISVLHCPYCHGYEVRQVPLGVIGNGDMGFEFCRLIHNWSSRLTLFTNGLSTLNEHQTRKLLARGVGIVEQELAALEHADGLLQQVVFRDGTRLPLAALFARVPFRQSCALPEELGCALTEQGLLQVDEFQRTTVPGVYAAGDNSILLRSVSGAVAAGTKAGALLNKELIEEDF